MAQCSEMWCRLVVTLCALVGIVTASTGRSYLERKPAKYKNIEGCYISDLDKVIPVGGAETSAQCVLFSCEKHWFDFYTCGFLRTNYSNCTVTTDKSKPYPDCCPIQHCEGSDEEDY